MRTGLQARKELARKRALAPGACFVAGHAQYLPRCPLLDARAHKRRGCWRMRVALAKRDIARAFGGHAAHAGA